MVSTNFYRFENVKRRISYDESGSFEEIFLLLQILGLIFENGVYFVSLSSAAYGTCSDFPASVAVGTDSSGELFVHGETNWSSDVSEARNPRQDRDGRNGDKENLVSGFGPIGGFDSQGVESGYGSEPGYKGDAEFGYGDEVDEEEDDTRLLFWGNQFGVVVFLVGYASIAAQPAVTTTRYHEHDRDDHVRDNLIITRLLANTTDSGQKSALEAKRGIGMNMWRLELWENCVVNIPPFNEELYERNREMRILIAMSLVTAYTLVDIQP
ncbi:hypothetical protein F8388_009861 [Cannabis sativa]|uniref:Uncharacterized protein n=1 Tax=Cannabis sativa TaxID=3483 RepID=A0A7J6H4P1_CANSA|nr:hypothetical protein F8388_009861 [Cannabis sativa]